MRGRKTSSDLRADWICRLRWLMLQPPQLTAVILCSLSQSFGQLDTIIIWNTYQSVPSHWVMLRDGLGTHRRHQHALQLTRVLMMMLLTSSGLGYLEPYVNGFSRICQSVNDHVSSSAPINILFRSNPVLCVHAAHQLQNVLLLNISSLFLLPLYYHNSQLT